MRTLEWSMRRLEDALFARETKSCKLQRANLYVVVVYKNRISRGVWYHRCDGWQRWWRRFSTKMSTQHGHRSKEGGGKKLAQREKRNALRWEKLLEKKLFCIARIGLLAFHSPLREWAHNNKFQINNKKFILTAAVPSSAQERLKVHKSTLEGFNGGGGTEEGKNTNVLKLSALTQRHHFMFFVHCGYKRQ